MILVVTATAREAAPLRHAARGPQPRSIHGIDVHDAVIDGAAIRLAVTGFARANTAYALSRLLLDDAPAMVLQVGVGGSFDVDQVAVGVVALASSDSYADLGSLTETGWVGADELGLPVVARGGEAWFGDFPCDAALTNAVATALGVPTGPFTTVETVTGTERAARDIAERTNAMIESMEGAAAAHACLLADVPFVQLRAASNIVGPRDRAAWRLDDAIDAAAAAARTAIPVLAAASR